MKTIKNISIALLLIILITPVCKGQALKYRDKIRPTVKRALDSLYPNATNIRLSLWRVVDTAQEIGINCNCNETADMIDIVFDTNGHLIEKDAYYHTLKDLPDTILHYVKKIKSMGGGYVNYSMIKGMNNKGEINYGIEMWEPPSSKYQASTHYIVRFKSTGEIISKEEALHGSR